MSLQQPRRRWTVRRVSEPLLRASLPDASPGITTGELFARFLTSYPVTPDTGFEWGRYYLLKHDDWDAVRSVREDDGALEYAVVDAVTLEQIDSVVFGWMDLPTAWEYLLDLEDGRYDNIAVLTRLSRDQIRLEGPQRLAMPGRGTLACPACGTDDSLVYAHNLPAYHQLEYRDGMIVAVRDQDANTDVEDERVFCTNCGEPVPFDVELIHVA